MPTYQYQCKECNHTFQLRGRINMEEREYPACPVCGGDVCRVIGNPALIYYKGGGFASTDL